MLQRLETLLDPLVAEQRVVSERRLQEAQIAINTHLEDAGRVGGGIEIHLFRKTFQGELEAFRDAIVELLTDNCSALQLPRNPDLERELHRLLDLWFIPAADEFDQMLQARLRSHPNVPSLERDRALQTAKARISLFIQSPPADLAQRDLVDYLRELELSLRSLVKTKYQKAYGAKWLEKLRELIGEEAFSAADATMRQRKAYSTEDFLHFTQLKDLYTAISQNWNVFSNAFSLRRAEFNSKMNEVLRGRTDEAHNRPQHLFPSIERKRGEIAAHDVLSALREGETLAVEARRAYFPYIRATQFLLDVRAKTLHEILQRLFSNMEIAVERALAASSFADLVTGANFALKIGRSNDDFERGSSFQNLLLHLTWGAASLTDHKTMEAVPMALVTRDRRVIVTPPAAEQLEESFQKLREFAVTGDAPKLFGDRR